MSRKAKSVTKAWALKDKRDDLLTINWVTQRPFTYSSRAQARAFKAPVETPVRVRVTVEEIA